MQKKMILKSDMRVYFDMDGTIAKWRDVPMEESRKPGYYTDLEPETELLDFLSAALKADKNMNILSSPHKFDSNTPVCCLLLFKSNAYEIWHAILVNSADIYLTESL